MNDEILKLILDALQGINNSINLQNDQLERLNENIESVTGTFQNRTFLNIVASVYEN